MNREANAAKHVARDGFWNDPTPMKLATEGIHSAEESGTPNNHLLFATSGSVGNPKSIAISKNALLASANSVNEHLGVTSESVWGLALPAYHVGGFGVVARARAAGCGLEIFTQPWSARGFTEWAIASCITQTSLVPTQVHDLVAAKFRAPNKLLAVVVGGGRLELAVGRAARALGWPVLASYGMTEASSQIATQPLTALNAAYAPSPIPVLAHWEARVDGEGCLEIAGPALFSGMVIGGVYRPRDGAWHATHDRVAATPEGLIPQGRADVLVKIAGELVDPQAVESSLAAALQEHGHGLAVVVILDARLGHRLICCAERGVPATALAAAIDAHNARVPRSQRLDAPTMIDEIPRGALGKIRRAALRDMLD